MSISHINGIAVANVSHFNGVAKGSIDAINGVTAGFGGGGGTPPEFIAAGAIAFSSGGSVAPVIPAHVADDILVVSSINVGNVEIDGPGGGWATIAEEAGGTYAHWLWKRAASSSETDPTLTAAGGSIYAAAYVIRGCVASGTPYEDVTITSYVASSHTAPMTSAIDTTGASRLVVGFFGRENDIAWTVSPPPSGWDLESDQTTTAGTDARLTVVSKEQPSVGTVSAVQIGEWAAGTSNWKSLTLGFIPA